MRRFIIALLITLPILAEARDRAVIREFKRDNPCPSTGMRAPDGPCPGYVVDHLLPLCSGGEDAQHNLQWQERQASYVKDRHERALCRRIAEMQKQCPAPVAKRH